MMADANTRQIFAKGTPKNSTPPAGINCIPA